jgi:hypothetical protein
MLFGDLVTTIIQHVSSACVYCLFVCVCTIARLMQKKKKKKKVFWVRIQD